MRRKGFDVSDVGYFLYCDGDRFSDYAFLGEERADMQFKMSLIEYQVDQSWIEPTLRGIRDCLDAPTVPDHAVNCEFGDFIQSVNRESET